MKIIDIKIKVLDNKALIPARQHKGDAGYDLHSIVEHTLYPHEIYKVKTGIAMEIPLNFAGLVLPRSGLSSKFGITLINSPGLIDSGYRGELLVPLVNHSEQKYTIKIGERVAQIIIVNSSNVEFILSENLDISERDEQGFGSTDE